MTWRNTKPIILTVDFCVNADNDRSIYSGRIFFTMFTESISMYMSVLFCLSNQRFAVDTTSTYLIVGLLVDVTNSTMGSQVCWENTGTTATANNRIILKHHIILITGGLGHRYFISILTGDSINTTVRFS